MIGIAMEVSGSGVVRLAPPAALLAIHAFIVLTLIPRWSATYNEPGHIAAGMACWQFGNYELAAVNPPLPRMVSTVPLLVGARVSVEPLRHVREQSVRRHEFEIGALFANENAANYHRVVCSTRLPGLFWVTLGGVTVWSWASRLFGRAGGLGALALWTFEPTVTAHASLATADTPATVMGLLATDAFARFCRTESWFHAYLAGVLLGVALLCKFTMLLVLPAWALAWVLESRAAARRASAGRALVSHRLGRLCLIPIVGWMLLNAGFAFDGTGTALGRLHLSSRLLTSVRRCCPAACPCPLPRAYVQGLDAQQNDFEGRGMSYLGGEWSSRGWRYFYLYAFALKSPLGHIGIYAFAFWGILRRRWPLPPLLWMFPLLLAIVSATKCGFTQHLRYILPAYPFIIILSGAAFARKPGERSARLWPPIALLVWSCASMLCAYPNLLGYFNEAVGGGQQGWRHLASSNVDWGQDWILLRDWLAIRRTSQPIHVALTEHVDSRIYLGQRYPLPRATMTGYAIADMMSLTRDYKWLFRYPVVSRIGTSLFVFDVRR